MAKGKIKFFLNNKGYGFITSDDSEEDHFFHVSDLPSRDVCPQPEQRVEFEIKQHPKGNRAANIRLV